MDKFEDIIKQAVEGYEAPFDPQAWEDVSKNLDDSFDHMVKEAVKGYKAPYNPSAWENIANQVGTSSNLWKWMGATAAVISVTIGTYYLTQSEEEQQTISESNDNLVANETQTEEKGKTNQTITFDTTIDSENLKEEENNAVVNFSAMDYEDIDNLEEVDQTINADHLDFNTNLSENTENITPADNDLNTSIDNTVENKTIYDVKATFKPSSTVICSNEAIVFTALDAQADLLYYWSFGDGSIGTGTNAEHNYSSPGEYTTRLEVRHPKTNEVLALEKQIVVVNPLPETDFGWEQNNEVIPTVQFLNQTEERVNSTWNIEGLKQFDQDEFEYTFRKAGKYAITLTTENQYGCLAKAKKEINIDQDYNLLAPNAFSPNGDFKNDVFIPKALQIMEELQFTMNIMDKTGEVVYSTRNANEPWDGIIVSDNTPAPAGSAYIWRVVITNKDGEKELYEGQIIVIR